MTVIRRVHSDNFTIMPNACLNDESLSACDLGVIAYLISRPANWIVRPTQLCDRFGCGRDKIQSILNKLIEIGYIRRLRHRAESGAWAGVEYVVLDTKDEPFEEPVAPSPEFPVVAAQPETENPATPNPKLLRTDSKKTDSNKPTAAKAAKPGEYTEEFENLVWKPYPRKAGTSKKDAFVRFQKLSRPDQELTIKSIPVFAAKMKSEARAEDKIKHLETYINGRVFETMAPTAADEPRRGPETASRYDWAVILLVYRSSNNWRLTWGPEPGRPGCHVPADMLTLSDAELRTIKKT